MAPTDTTPLVGAVDRAVEAETAAIEELGRSWKWIMALGIMNVIGGFACLMAPVTATFIAEQVISFTLLFVGAFNLITGCVTEDFLKAYYFALGAVQIAIGVVMVNNPWATVATLTFVIAFVVLFDGLYHVIVCCQSDRSQRGWCLMFTSGLASMAIGIIVLTGFPESSLYTIGILLGVNLITIGNVRMHLAWEGRFIASSQTNTEGTPSVNV